MLIHLLGRSKLRSGKNQRKSKLSTLNGRIPRPLAGKNLSILGIKWEELLFCLIRPDLADKQHTVRAVNHFTGKSN